MSHPKARNKADRDTGIFNRLHFAHEWQLAFRCRMASSLEMSIASQPRNLSLGTQQRN